VKKKIQNLFTSWLGASSKEVSGTLTLIMMIVIGMVILKLINREGAAGMGKPSQRDQVFVDSLAAIIDHVPEAVQYAEPEPVALDPNTASFSQLTSIGFSKEVANRILKYRNTGARFHQKNDLLKIYGLSDSMFHLVSPLIRLPSTLNKRTNPKPVFASGKQAKTRPTHVVQHFDINKADTSELMKIHGIGPVLSVRILKFRKRLGGFVDLDQLYEVYHLDTAIVKKMTEFTFVDPSFVPRKININEWSVGELMAHPYITSTTARLIVSYRKQHGKFRQLNELYQINSLDSLSISRLKPYVLF